MDDLSRKFYKFKHLKLYAHFGLFQNRNRLRTNPCSRSNRITLKFLKVKFFSEAICEASWKVNFNLLNHCYVKWANSRLELIEAFFHIFIENLALIAEFSFDYNIWPRTCRTGLSALIIFVIQGRSFSECFVPLTRFFRLYWTGNF